MTGIKEKTSKAKKEVGDIVSIPESKTSVDVFIEKAIEKNVGVETMERLLTMRRELRAEYAKSEYDRAMSEFQSECPIIKKKKKAYGYFYAPLEVIVEQVKKILQKHGFSYAVQTKTEEGKVKVVCTAKHIAGHSEQSDMEVPIGAGTKMMSAPQAVAAATTFAKRYAFCNAFGILTGDDDTDAQQENADEAKKKQVEIAIEKLKGAINLNALGIVWGGISGELKTIPEIVAVKDTLKLKLTPQKDENKPIQQ